MNAIETSTIEQPVDSGSFESEVSAAQSVVQSALTEVIAGLSGNICRPVELQRALGLDYKLCWQIFEVVGASGSLAASRNVPTSAAAVRFLAASARQGVRPEVLERAQEAINAFNRLIVSHAGDRAAFEAMVTAVCPSDSGVQGEMQQRRAAYRAMSHILGRQAETIYGAMIARRSDAGDHAQCCNLTRKIGINRLRLDVPAEAFGSSQYPKPTDADGNCEPLDAKWAAIYGAPMLPDFCSKPLPKFVEVHYQAGWTRFERENPGVGRRSAIDLAFGQVVRKLEFSKDVDDRNIFYSGGIFTLPVKLFISDLLVHRPSFGRVQPELLIFEPIAGDDSPAAARRAQQFPIDERLMSLGKGIGVTQTNDLPRNREMLQYAFDVLKWDPNDFDVFRLKMPFPIYQSSIRILFNV